MFSHIESCVYALSSFHLQYCFSERGSIILCGNSIKVRSSTNWGRLRHWVWLKGQNNRVLKVNVLQQQNIGTTLSFCPLFNSALPFFYFMPEPLKLLFTSSPTARQRRGMRLCWRGQCFPWSWNKHLSLFFSFCVSVCLSLLFIKMCDPSSRDTTQQSLIAPVTPPFSVCQSLFLSLEHTKHSHSLVLVRGGATSTLGSSPPLPPLQCVDRGERNMDRTQAARPRRSQQTRWENISLWISAKVRTRL